MKISKRISSILVLALICFFCIYFPLVFIMPDMDKINSSILAFGTSLLVGIILLFITKDENDKFLNQLFKTALIIGSIGFTLGFFGPIIFLPESNLGPLFGIFITGPLSFLAGLIGGGVYWKTRNRKTKTT